MRADAVALRLDTNGCCEVDEIRGWDVRFSKVVMIFWEGVSDKLKNILGLWGGGDDGLWDPPEIMVNWEAGSEAG